MVPNNNADKRKAYYKSVGRLCKLFGKSVLKVELLGTEEKEQNNLFCKKERS